MLQIRPCPSTLNWKADKPSSHTVDVFNLIHNIGGDCPWTGSGMQVSFFPSNTAIMLEVIKPPTSLKTSIPPFTENQTMIIIFFFPRQDLTSLKVNVENPI